MAVVALDLDDAEALGGESAIDLGNGEALRLGGWLRLALGQGGGGGEAGDNGESDESGLKHDGSSLLERRGEEMRRSWGLCARPFLTRRRRKLSAKRQARRGTKGSMRSRRFLILAAIALALAPVAAEARRSGREGDHDEARQAVARGEAMSLSQILPLALRAVPGEVLEVELEREDGILVYEIEILARDGRVRQVELNARTGAVLDVEDDD